MQPARYARYQGTDRVLRDLVDQLTITPPTPSDREGMIIELGLEVLHLRERLRVIVRSATEALPGEKSDNVIPFPRSTD